MATLASFEVKFNKSFGVGNRHRRDGQSQNRFTKLAEESRLNHLKVVYELMERAFLSRGVLLVERIMVAGPRLMKSQFLEYLPRVWTLLVEQQLVTTTAVGSSSCLAS